MRRLAALTALSLLAAAAPAAAQTVTRGATLDPARAPNHNSDCRTQPFADVNSPTLEYQPILSNQPSCTWWQTFVFGNTADTRSGFVPSDGVITSVSVRSGPNPAPIRFTILRQLTNAQLGAVSGEPVCCVFVRETPAVQPTANAVSTFAVNLPVENNRQPNIITNDIIGISAASNTGSLPIFAIPGQTNQLAFTQFGTLNAAGVWPAMGSLPNDTGGGRREVGMAGFELQMSYTFTPITTPPVIGGGGGGVISPAPPIRLGPTDIVSLGGGVLRPIGGALDVVLDCKQTACAGSINLLTRSPVRAAAVKKGAARKIRSIGSKKFTLKQGKKRKVRVKLNKLGLKLSKAGTVKAQVVADFGAIGKTTKNVTVLKRSTAKKVVKKKK